MESALRPRDIQARIRAGASPEEVAQAAGVPLERIGAFAAPVIAERDYIAGLARTNPVRRRGETTSHRTLRNAVIDSLAARGVDADAADWDAWKLEDRRWQVRVGFEVDGERREGLFVFDPMGRFSVSANDEARTLIGDDVVDQLALVRATQDPVVEDEAAEVEEPRPNDDDAFDAEDAFHEGDLTEVDGVYDIVPPERGDMDVLYDMLSSFDEDSVKIYAGLVHPKEATPEPDSPVVVEVVERSVNLAAVSSESHLEDDGDEPVDDEAEESLASAADEDMTGLVPRVEPIRPPVQEEQAGAGPVAPGPALDEPEQLSLIDDLEEPTPRPKPRTRRKRASVPSWDEIMFGAPHPTKPSE